MTIKPRHAPSPDAPDPLDTFLREAREYRAAGHIAPSPDAPGPSLDAEKVTSKLDIDRVAAFLHDEYGCRMSCRGGRLADDRHPSHSEAYRDQAERLVAALGDGHE